jgi:hypothetical protein
MFIDISGASGPSTLRVGKNLFSTLKVEAVLWITKLNSVALVHERTIATAAYRQS